MRIYLDHNAGAPLRPEVRAAIARFSEADEATNPAAVHRSGQRARRALEQARAQVARLIGAAAREIVFTSGGTESNNLAIRGVAGAQAARRRIVSSAIEHSSILAPLEYLAGRGFERGLEPGFEIVRIAPDRDGRIAPAAVAAALDADTALVTMGLANAEVGTIQDVAAMAEPIARAGAMFHIDAAQAAGRIPLRVGDLRCDLLTISGHKLGAPAGIGALYVRAGVALAPAMLGGPQEAGIRAGTPNLLGAVAFGVAAEAAAAHLGEESARVATLAARLLERLRASIPDLRFNGPATGRIANTLNLTFPGVLGESMLIALDLEGVEVSMGSACAAGAVEPSHVLLAIGLGRDEARSSLRLSLGWSTTADEIDRAAEIIARVWRRVRAAEPVRRNVAFELSNLDPVG
ncbi:MAG TPA: cysteine desulfurase family protein [Candidatus Binataceae bacterium]|nr:cysteine desulfurase family protein [Candidatus Binataceae bacterium]